MCYSLKCLQNWVEHPFVLDGCSKTVSEVIGCIYDSK